MLISRFNHNQEFADAISLSGINYESKIGVGFNVDIDHDGMSDNIDSFINPFDVDIDHDGMSDNIDSFIG